MGAGRAFVVVGVVGVVRSMGFMELFGAVLAFEFVAFAGKGEGTGGGKRQQEKFHDAP